MLYSIYFSPTGGTQRVAELLAAQWDCETQTIDLMDPAQVAAAHCFSEDDLCILAIPVFGGRVPALAVQSIAAMQGGGARAVLVAVYGNRACDDALLELKDTAAQAGFVCVAGIFAVAEHSILRQFGACRPDAQDVGQLAEFAQRIKSVLPLAGKGAALQVPGNHPYKEYKVIPTVPKAARGCAQCGVCARACPMHGIAAENAVCVNKANCISCMRCVAVCPQKSRRVNPLLLKAAALKLASACGSRKDNALFLIGK